MKLTNEEKLKASMAMLMGDSFTKGDVTMFPVDGPTNFCVMQMIGPADQCKKFETGYWPAALEKFDEFMADAIAQKQPPSKDTANEPPYENGADYWRDIVQTTVSFDAALYNGEKFLEAMTRKDCTEDELRFCNEFRATMDEAATGRLEKAAAYIIETSARETQTGSYLTYADDMPEDIISPKAFAEYIKDIEDIIAEYGAVLDVEISTDGTIDVNMFLAYCPNYVPLDEETGDFPEDRPIFDPLLTRDGTDIAAEAPELNEAEQNFAAWMAVTESSRYRWVEDEIIRLNGRGAMYYTGGEDGVYMRIHNDGKLEAGDYEGAIPHIGEAFFKPAVTKQYDSFSDAYKAAMEAGGKKFMVDMFSGSEPQPLYQSKRGLDMGKPSVLKAIRDAQNAPKPPRKDKAPEQRKNKNETEL